MKTFVLVLVVFALLITLGPASATGQGLSIAPSLITSKTPDSESKQFSWDFGLDCDRDQMHLGYRVRLGGSEDPVQWQRLEAGISKEWLTGYYSLDLFEGEKFNGGGARIRHRYGKQVWEISGGGYQSGWNLNCQIGIAGQDISASVFYQYQKFGEKQIYGPGLQLKAGW